MAKRLAFVIGALAMVTLALAQPRVLRSSVRDEQFRPVVPLADTFQNVLVRHQVPQGNQQAALKQFQALDPALQHRLLTAMDENYAAAHEIPAKTTPIYRINHGIIISPFLSKPSISAIFPAQGESGQYSIVYGSLLDTSTRVLWEGNEQATIYFPALGPFPAWVGFKVPAGVVYGSSHAVTLRNLLVPSNAVNYEVVAPRGYRGVYGWQFANFGNPNIPWYLFRDFFGSAAVEYTLPFNVVIQKPSALAWYESTYAGIGGGGNCYGMSNSSLRIRNNHMTTYHAGWFTAHPQDYCWLYPWQTETQETAQEDQGGQLSAEMAATTNDYWNNQDHKAAWDRIKQLAAETSNKPVVDFWYVGHWGHTVVGYGTQVSGSQHRIQLYDNNEPYSQTENGGPNKSIAYVDWNDDTFHANSYSTANKMVCVSYDECMRTPHLPAEAGGSATGTVVGVVEGGQVQQVEDEAGHRFFAANGQENTDPNSRIPQSMHYIPMQAAGQEYRGPAIFIFNQASNKNLTFTVGGAGAKRLSFFQPGSVFRTEFAGQGRLKLNHILTPSRELELPDPQPLRPSTIRMILVRADERLFDLQGLNLGAAAVVATPAPTGDGLDVRSGGVARFNLAAETFVNGQHGQALFRGVTTQANGRTLLQPQDWNNLRGTSLNLNLRNLNNQQLRQLRIQQ